jgi:hypothetical protein
MKVLAKIGTHSQEQVVVRTTPVVGKPIMFRRPSQRTWEHGFCDKIIDGPVYFIALL